MQISYAVDNKVSTSAFERRVGVVQPSRLFCGRQLVPVGLGHTNHVAGAGNPN